MSSSCEPRRRAGTGVLALLLGVVTAGVMLLGPPVQAAPAEPADPLAAAGTATSSACQPDAHLVNPCRPWLGAHASHYSQTGSSLAAQIAYHEQRIGRQLDIVHSYHRVGVNTLSKDEQALAKRPGTHLFLNWKPSQAWGPAGGRDAAVNRAIDTQALSIKALGTTKVFLALYHEPENDVSGGATGCGGIRYIGKAGTPADYRAMWRNVRNRFDALGVTNVVWAMNYMSYDHWRCFVDDLYPGNDLVDWIFYDAYGRGPRATFEGAMRPMYDYLTTASDATHDYVSKPWGLAEWNTDNPSSADEAAFYREAQDSVEKNRLPRLKAFLAYDTVAPEGGDYRTSYFNFQPDSGKQTAYATFARSQAFVDHGVQQPVPDDAGTPTARILSPRQGARASGRITVRARTSDTTRLARVWLEVDGSVVDEKNSGGPVRTFSVDTRALPGGPHVLTVHVEDASGNAGVSDAVRIEVDNDFTTPSKDKRKPSTPKQGWGSAQAGLLTLGWRPSTDNTGVTGYEVYRDGALVGTFADPSYADDGPAPGDYTFTVRARDANANVSPPSAGIDVSVVDVVAPTAPGGLSAVATTAGVSLTWLPSTDDVGVAGYAVVRDGRPLGPALSGAYTDTTAGQGRSHTYTVVALDAAGNQSTAAAPVTVTVPDVTAPSAPGRPVVSRVDGTLTLGWPTGRDNVGVAGYEVFRNRARIGSSWGAAYTDSSARPGRTYRYRVLAVDAAGNRGPRSPWSLPVTR